VSKSTAWHNKQVPKSSAWTFGFFSMQAGHDALQMPQPTHRARSVSDTRKPAALRHIETAPAEHAPAQAPQPQQSPDLTTSAQLPF
jgi:hypothetical protein